MHKPELYVFGFTVCAAAPSAADMIVGRFAFGCYLGPVMARTSHLVNLKLKDGTLKLVQASSIKVVMPLRFDLELMGTFGRRSVGALHEPPSRWETPKIPILSLFLCPLPKMVIPYALRHPRPEPYTRNTDPTHPYTLDPNPTP